jgi:hypothetical protein
MRFKRIILNIFLFIAVGEIILRFDEKFKLFEGTNIVKIPISIAETQEYNLIKENKINLSDSALRVMVIGDSYIRGAGLKTEDNFAQQLKSILVKNNNKFNNVYVFDASIPKNNNLDNNITYFEYVDKFKPNIVVLGYNYNDVLDNLDLKPQNGKNDSLVENRRSYFKETSLIKRVAISLFKSEFIRYVHTNLYSQLKVRGIIIPNSEFGLMIDAYATNSDKWVKSKMLLQGIIDDSQKKKIQLIALNCPQTNMIEYPKVFLKADSVIKQFFTTSPSVMYVNLIDIFKGESSKTYILSKYDGHANEKAHKKIAQYVFSLIETIPTAKANF